MQENEEWAVEPLCVEALGVESAAEPLYVDAFCVEPFCVEPLCVEGFDGEWAVGPLRVEPLWGEDDDEVEKRSHLIDSTLRRPLRRGVPFRRRPRVFDFHMRLPNHKGREKATRGRETMRHRAFGTGRLLSRKVLPWPDPMQAAKQPGFIKCPRQQSQTAGEVAL